MAKDSLRAEFQASLLRIRDGIIWAGVGWLMAIPHIYDQTYSLFPRLFRQPAPPEKMKLFILGELILYFFALLLFVLIGNLANRRAELNPFRSPGLKNILGAFALGILLIPVSYFLYDHLALALLPEAYPRQLVFAFAYPFATSFPPELFNRFGLLSLLIWIFGKKQKMRSLASILCALLLTFLGGYDLFRLIEVPLKATEVVMALAGLFLFQWLGNELYLKNGFWASLAFRFALALKLLLYFFLFFNS